MIICIRIKYEKIAHLYPTGTFPAFHYMFYIFLGGDNSRNTQDIKFKFSAFLTCVGATKCVKFQRSSCTGLKVSMFQIRPSLFTPVVWIYMLLYLPLCQELLHILSHYIMPNQVGSHIQYLVVKAIIIYISLATSTPECCHYKKANVQWHTSRKSDFANIFQFARTRRRRTLPWQLNWRTTM